VVVPQLIILFKEQIMQISDDIMLGPVFIGGPGRNTSGPSAMELGVGPLGRCYCFDAVPAASNTTSSQNEICTTANLPTGALVLTANGTTTLAGTDNNGNAIVILDCERTVAIYSAADLSSKTMTISGYDRYGQPVSQAITCPNATTVQTTKTFKSIKSVSSSGAIASACVVGIGTGIGLPYRLTDLGYVMTATYNQTAIVVSSTLVKVADTTATATTSTADVRGYVITGQTDGTKRLVVNYMLPALASGPNATRIGAAGVTQA
jgi:hypothetical protein